MGVTESMSPPVLATSLVMSAEQYAQLQSEQGALEIARAYTITGTPEEQALIAKEANTELRSVKARIKSVEEWRERFTEPAMKIVEAAKALFNPALTTL